MYSTVRTHRKRPGMKTRSAPAAPMPTPDPGPDREAFPATGYTGVRPTRRTPPAVHLLGNLPSGHYFRPTPSALDPAFPRRPVREPAGSLHRRQRALAGLLVGLGLALGLAGAWNGLGHRAPTSPATSPLVALLARTPTAIPGTQAVQALPPAPPTAPARLGAPVPTATPVPRTHVVQQGEFLAVIADAANVSLGDL